MDSRARWPLAVAGGFLAATLSAQTPPLGSEFQVSSSDDSFADAPSVIDFRGVLFGGPLFIWQADDPTPKEDEIFGRRFDPTAGSGPQFRVNTATAFHHQVPSVSLGGGGFVVVWDSYTQDGSSDGIFGQRFSQIATGSILKLGTEFPVNTYVEGRQTSPRVGGDAAGNFVVVWSGAGPDDAYDVHGQRFDHSGVAVGTEFRVNASTTGRQGSASVAVNPDGSFVVVWENDSYDIIGQRFDTSGAKAGVEFPVNTYSTDSHINPRVASDRFGNFVVVWENDLQHGSGPGIFGQVFNSAAERIGSEFQANSDTTHSQADANLAVDSSGNFVVVWSIVRSGDKGDIIGQRFDPSGRRSGSEFQVSTETTGFQTSPAALRNGDGLTVVWASFNDEQIHARMPAFVAESSMKVDAHSGAGTSSNVNGVLEPGEAVLVETGWRRPGIPSDTVSLTGAAANLTGPSGPVYLINHAAADFGDVGSGVPPSCYDATPSHECYVVSVAGARPDVHWDATFEETVSAGGGEPRTLHIGDSFSDVPRTQPFYTKIETALHAGIATGCGGTKYCPGDQVSRAQMAIFLARGLAGSGERVPSTGTLLGTTYTCGPGGHSLFTDVAPTDSACKHIHYIGRQNVTLGCGVAKYCPSDVVTRDAMASFIAKAKTAPMGAAGVPLTYGPDPGTGLSYSCDPGSPNVHFTDVPATDPFCKHVHYLWAKGIVGGCTATQFCPSSPVTRDAMAKFIANGFQLQLYGP